MSAWLQTWGTLLTSVVLVGVTAWYAVLTRSLAKAARESARSAENAAKYSAESAAAVIASVDVSFELSPGYLIDGALGDDESYISTWLRCTGATVFVHGVTLDSADRSTNRSRSRETFESLIADPLQLLPDDRTSLPVRMHKDEQICFSPITPVRIEGVIAMLEGTVYYSLSPDAPPVPREVDWIGVAGTDYPDPGPDGRGAN